MDDIDVLADRRQGPQDLCNPDGKGDWAGSNLSWQTPQVWVFAVEGALEGPLSWGEGWPLSKIMWRGRGGEVYFKLLIRGFYPVIDHPFLKRHHFGDDMAAPANDATKHGCGVAETSQPTQMRQVCSGRMNQPEIR